MPINQPSNQIRLTNVSLVRLKKGKKRFEIACYKNKVLEYRSGQETDLDNVLQIHNVFMSVSKGQTAPSADLEKAFGKDHKLDDIIQEILRKGEMQVGDKERGAQKERLEKEVVDIIAGKVVDPRSKRVYTAGIIHKALDQLSSQSAQTKQDNAGATAAGHHPNNHHDSTSILSQKPHSTTDPSATPDSATKSMANLSLKQKEKPLWMGVSTTKSAKSQALDAIKALIAWQIMPIARARMRLRVSCPTQCLKQGLSKTTLAQFSSSTTTPSDSSTPTEKDAEADSSPAADKHSKTLKDLIISLIETVESQDTLSAGEWQITGFVEPGALKTLNDVLTQETRGRGKVEVLDTAVTHDE